MLLLTRAGYPPRDRLSVPHSWKTMALSRRKRVGQRQARKRKQQVRLSTLVFVDDVDVRRRGQFNLQRQGFIGGNLRSRFQSLHRSALLPIERRFDAVLGGRARRK